MKQPKLQHKQVLIQTTKIMNLHLFLAGSGHTGSDSIADRWCDVTQFAWLMWGLQMTAETRIFAKYHKSKRVRQDARLRNAPFRPKWEENNGLVGGTHEASLSKTKKSKESQVCTVFETFLRSLHV